MAAGAMTDPEQELQRVALLRIKLLLFQSAVGVHFTGTFAAGKYVAESIAQEVSIGPANWDDGLDDIMECGLHVGPYYASVMGSVGPLSC